MTLPTRTAPESADVTVHVEHPLTSPAPVTDWPTAETVMLRPERDHAGVNNTGHASADTVTLPRDHTAGHVNTERSRDAQASHVTGVTAADATDVTAPAETGPPADAGDVTKKDQAKSPRAAGAPGYYLVALMSLVVSLNTSWKFFTDVFVIADVNDRIAIFSILEVFLIVLGWGMRANVRRGDPPGTPRLVALSLLGFAGYMAVAVSSPWEGFGRVVFGPGFGLIALHLALGIEQRVREDVKSAWRRFSDQVKQRVLSHFGLADEDVSAQRLRRDRYVEKAAKLITKKRVWRRDARLQRALRIAQVACDPVSQAHLTQHLAVLRNLQSLYNLQPDAPWAPARQEQLPAPVSASPEPRRRTTTRPVRRASASRRPAVPAAVEEPSVEQPPALDAPTEQAPEAVTNVIQMADARPGVKAMAAKLLAWMDATETTEIPATTKIAKVTGYAKGYAGAAADLVRQELAARERTA